MTTGVPFNMDMAVQVAQTQGFKGLVEAASANNNQMMMVADQAMLANKGAMSNAFQGFMGDIHQTALSNNKVLDTISTALHMGIQSTGAQEAENAGNLQSLIGAVSGAHFT